ncbi:hypothetical protein KVT40_000461 [Elsinoe batatas]|uniref:Uncharacterized protein n=1 Tax=Elsinoe batatas TaxID=2601811 RepID=A0A8K0PIN2_9PEZI|nr:hypothetical protein KVT40_000461 [Elsinoe batatas]
MFHYPINRSSSPEDVDMDANPSDLPRETIDTRPLSGSTLALAGNPDEIKAWLHRATIERGCRVKGLCRLCKFGDSSEGHIIVTPVIKYLLHDYYVKNGLECRLGWECPLGHRAEDNQHLMTVLPEALQVLNTYVGLDQCVHGPYCLLGEPARPLEIVVPEMVKLCELHSTTPGRDQRGRFECMKPLFSTKKSLDSSLGSMGGLDPRDRE